MALVLNEEQQMLRDSAAGFLAEKAPVSALRALRDQADGTGFDRSVWQGMVDMGWAGIAIDEQYGGLGYGYTGLGLILEQCGRNLSVSPLQSTVLVAASVIAQLGSDTQKQTLLAGIASGESVISLAMQEAAHHDIEYIDLSATREGDHYVLNGRKVFVLDAAQADQFILIARTSGSKGEQGGLTAFLLDAYSDGLTVIDRSMVDSRSAGELELNGVTVSVDKVLGAVDDAWDGLNTACDIANIGLASELLGIASEAFERTVSYLKERKQFGKVIGSFQGLAHRAAHLFAELELARSIVLQALQAIDEGADNLSQLASAAKAKLCEVAELATNEGIQMHGGIGMTDEFDMGFFIKRARMVQYSFGDYNYHLDRYAVHSGF